MALLKKTQHVNYKGANVDSNSQTEQEELPIDKIVCMFAGEHNGAKGFHCRLTDKTEMFLPTPSDADKDEMWNELNEALDLTPILETAKS